MIHRGRQEGNSGAGRELDDQLELQDNKMTAKLMIKVA
jgi:hypothetical protein